MRAPTLVKRWGFFRNCTISCSSSFSSSAPATSLKLTLLPLGSVSRARERPKLIMPLPPPVCWRIRKYQSRPNSTTVTSSGTHSTHHAACAGWREVISKSYSVGLTARPSTLS